MKPLLSPAIRCLLRAALGLFLGAVLQVGAFDYTYSPTNTPPGAMYFNGSASQLTDRFQLTPYAGSKNGAIVLDNLPKTIIKSFTAQFGLRMTNTSSSSVMADGVSFNFGPGITTDSVTSEKGITNGLAVAFDTFKNNTAPYIDPDWVPGISIRWNGTDLASTNIASTFDSLKTSAAFHDVIVTLLPPASPGGLSTVTVQYQGVALSAQVQYSPTTDQTWRMMLAGRTGANWSEQSINQIHVTGEATELTVISSYGAGQTSPLEGTFNPAAFEYTYDPANPQPGTMVFNGSAANRTNLFLLTPNASNQKGSIVLNNLPQVSINVFTARIGLRMTNAGGSLADGVSFNFGPNLATNSLVTETGITNGLAVSFNTFNDGSEPSWVAGIGIFWNGAVVATSSNLQKTFNNSRNNTNFYDVVITLQPVSGSETLSTVSVEYQGVTLNGLVPYAPATNEVWGMVIGARTGGSSAEQSLNRIQLSGTSLQPVAAPTLVGKLLTPSAGVHEITEKGVVVLQSPQYVYLDRYRRELDPTPDNINSVAHYRARLDDPAATVTPSGGAASYGIANGASITVDRDTTVTWHWVVDNLAEVDSGTSGVTNLSATDITDATHVDTLGRRYLSSGTTGFDSLVRRAVTPATEINVRFGSRGYVMENAPNSPERYLELAGEGDHLRTTAANPVLPAGATNYTVEFWARPNLTSGTAREQVVLSLGSLNGAGQRLLAGFGADRGFFVSDGATRVSALPGWTDKEWHHWAAVCRGNGDSNSVVLYRDGVLVQQSAAVFAPLTGDGTVTIGARAVADYATAFYSGGVNNVRVWDHTLERTNLFVALATKQFSNSTSGLLLEMPFDTVPVNSAAGVHVERLTGPAGITNIADVAARYTLRDSYTASNFLLPSTNAVPSGNTNAWHHRSRLVSASGGRYTFALQSSGIAQFWVDGQLLIDKPTAGTTNANPASITLSPGGHVLETWMIDPGGTRALSLTYSPDSQLTPLAAIPDASLSLAASDLLTQGLITLPSTEGSGLVFVARGFDSLFPANTAGSTMVAAILPGFRLGLTRFEGGQNTVQIDPIGKAPLDDWRRVFWGWNKEFQFKVGVICTAGDGIAAVSKLPYFTGEVAEAKVDGGSSIASAPAGGGVVNVLELWLREGERLTVGTVYRTPDRRYTLDGISGNLNIFGDITLDKLIDAVRANGAAREYPFPAAFGPGSLNFTYGDTIHRANLALGEGLDVSSLAALNASLAPPLPDDVATLQVNRQGPPASLVVPDPGGATAGGSGQGWIWDFVAKKWYPTRPGVFSVTWVDQANRTNTIEVTAGFAGDTLTRSNFLAFENKDGSRQGSADTFYRSSVTFPAVSTNYPGAPQSHYVYNLPPDGARPSPGDLDPRADDAWFFKEFSYTENNTATVKDTRIFTDTRAGNRSVLAFSRRTNATQVATGDLSREAVTIRVLRTGETFNQGTATVGSRLESAGDQAGFHSGVIVEPSTRSKNFNPALYNTNAAVGQWGPIYPVNYYSAGAGVGQPLLVDWYADTSRLVPGDPVTFLPAINTTYAQILWPDSSSAEVIYLSSQMGSEGVGQAAVTNGPPNYQPIFSATNAVNLAIYHQPDRGQNGYNPNEEHAFIAPSRAYVLTGDPRFNPPQSAVFALQNGLNNSDTNSAGYTSDPFVLVQYGVPGATNASDAFAMKAYVVKKVRPGDEGFPVVDHLTGTAFKSNGQPVSQPANPRYDFEFPALAGSVVVPPYPLNLVIGNVVLPETTGGNLVGTNTVNAQRAVWADKNGVHWVVSGGWNARFFERYFYPLRGDFWLGEKPAGTPVAWAPPSAIQGDINSFLAPAISVAAKYNARWGNNYPVLKRGETLTYPGGEYKADHPASPGLPAILNMASAELVFDGATPSMLLVTTNCSTDYSPVQGIRGTTYYNGDKRDGYIETLGDIFTEGNDTHRASARYQQGRGATEGNDYGYRGYFTAADSDSWLHKSLEIPNEINGQPWPGMIKERSGDGEKLDSRAHWLRTLLKVEVDGNYVFYLESGDGSRLYLDGELLVNADGYVKYVDDEPSKSASAGKQLSKGFHALEVQYFDQGPKSGLDKAKTKPRLVIEYACAEAGIARGRIPSDKLYVDPEDPFLTEDQRKLFSPVSCFPGLSARVTRPLDRYAVSFSREAIPGDLQPANPAKVLVSGSRWYFKDLPASLGKRFYYDSLVGELVFRGRLNDLESGAPSLTRQPVQPYVLEPNFLTHEDAEKLIALPEEPDSEWTEAIDALMEAASTPYTTSEDTGLGLVPVTNQTALPFYAETASDAATTPLVYAGFSTGVGSVVPVSSFGIGSSLVPSPGTLFRDHNGPIYLAVAENNDPRATGAVALHIIQLSEERYRGSIQVLTPQDAFSEKINLKHTGDFGANTAEIYYQWYVRDVVNLPSAGTPDGVNTNAWQVYQQGLGLNAIEFTGRPDITLADKLFFVRYGHLEELQEADETNHPEAGKVSAGSWRNVLPDDPQPDWAPPSHEDPRVPFQWAGAANSPQLQADGSRRYLPQLVMGWVKRILDQINPYEARYSATFSGDAPATYSSMLQQAGGPYIGPVALNADKSNLENVGLIQLYETVLQRAKDLTAGTAATAGTDQALLLAATRLASLYSLVAGEAWADAQTGIIPQSVDLPDDAASYLFAFKNQVPTALDEQLALLRGTDFVKAYPAFNRLFWNYFKADGEAAYNAVYRVGDANNDGLIDESDAAIAYPMGHGDAWGHYLSAVKMHYDLLRRPGFTWQARAELYSLLGNVLPVDYLDEKTFATLAAARARTGLSVMKATYAQSYSADPALQWQGYADEANPARAWGATEWSRRTGQGAWFDWLAANAMTPAPGTNTVEGLDRIDRAANQAEVGSLAAALVEVQQQLDNVNRGQNPIGLDADAIAFDIDPFYDGVWWERAGQFQQVYDRALAAANNALAAYNFARRSDQQLRRLADDTSALKDEALRQDLDYKNQLIAIYGRPYQGTVGPGKIFAEGYDGPDLVTYLYMDVTDPHHQLRPTSSVPGVGEFVWETSLEEDVIHVGNALDFGAIAFQPTRGKENALVFDGFYLTQHWPHLILDTSNHPHSGAAGDTVLSIKLPITEMADVALQAPSDWGSRAAYGSIQAGLNDVLASQVELDIALEGYNDYVRKVQIQVFNARQKLDALREKLGWAGYNVGIATANLAVETTLSVLSKYIESLAEILVPEGGYKLALLGGPINAPFGKYQQVEAGSKIGKLAIPNDFNLAGGDSFLAPLRVAQEIKAKAAKPLLKGYSHALEIAIEAQQVEEKVAEIAKEFGKEKIDAYNEFLEIIKELAETLSEEEGQRGRLMAPLQKQNWAGVTSLIAQGERLQMERAALNRQLAASAQRNRYADLVVRLSRNEAARKFDAALDNALRYAWLAAKAYDYETSLSEGHPAGIQTLLDQIVQTRSLGLWEDGQPRVGNGGLAELLARLKSNYDALKGQIGLNNAQFESSLFSLRTEALRIATDDSWVEFLRSRRVADLWQVPEFRQYCRPFDHPTNGAQPGLVIEFSTTMTPGENFFGRALGAMDHAFSTANYATKIRELAVGFPGYDEDGGGQALSTSPRVYLLPVGQDVQRCSDSRFPTTRTWNVVSQRIPVPYVLNEANLRDAGFQPSMDGLDGSFVDRLRYGDFRAFTSDGDLDASSDLFAAPAPPGWSLNARLYGRSVWNTRWVLIIPGATLAADKEEGLERFITTVKDIKLFLQTYSNMGM